MRALLFTLLLAGCPLPEDKDTGDTDTGDTADTDDTGPGFPDPYTWTDADATCDNHWDEADLPGFDRGGGCGWGFVWAEDADTLLQLDLPMDAADFEAEADVAYDFAVGTEAVLEVLELGAGTDEMSFWSCSDYMEGHTGTKWVGTSGTVRVETRYLCATVDPYCGDTDREYHAVVYIRDVGMTGASGTSTSLADQELRVTLGVTECGG